MVIRYDSKRQSTQRTPYLSRFTPDTTCRLQQPTKESQAGCHLLRTRHMTSTEPQTQSLRSRLTDRKTLDVVSTVAILAAAATLIWTTFRAPSEASRPQRSSVPLPREPVSIADSPTRGRADAPVVVIEFSDFECPFCSRFVKDTLPELQTTYIDAGKVQFAFRHLPLTKIHEHALAAATTADCAGAQGKFWQVHDALFARAGRLTQPDLEAAVSESGVDRARLASCVADSKAERVNRDIAEAKNLQLSGTPVFLLGTRQGDGRVAIKSVISGARPPADFARELDALLGQL
jgi:protein-disulfide isomerase